MTLCVFYGIGSITVESTVTGRVTVDATTIVGRARPTADVVDATGTYLGANGGRRSGNRAPKDKVPRDVCRCCF